MVDNRSPEAMKPAVAATTQTLREALVAQPDTDRRVLQSPNAPYFGDKPPMEAGTYREMLRAFLGMVALALTETLRQFAGIPAWVYIVWAPLILALPGFWMAYRDQQSVNRR